VATFNGRPVVSRMLDHSRGVSVKVSMISSMDKLKSLLEEGMTPFLSIRRVRGQEASQDGHGWIMALRLARPVAAFILLDWVRRGFIRQNDIPAVAKKLRT